MSDDVVPPRPAPGTRLLFRWRKWDGGEHWTHECVYLGSDRWGDWFGQLAGWRSSRPGRVLEVRGRSVSVLPPGGDHVVTLNVVPPASYRVYIDLAWDARWQDGEPTGIDMDLDVVDAVDARGIFIDDRDEWDEHRVAYGYPLDIVEKLESLAVELERRVRAGVAPYDAATAAHWLARLDALGLA